MVKQISVTPPFFSGRAHSAFLNRDSHQAFSGCNKSHAPHDLPEMWRDWLLDSGSLTRRLQQAFPGPFEVKVLWHSWGIPTARESRFIGMSPRRIASIREVLLICGGRPRVYARSILPRASLAGENRCLLSLGNKPLGEFLFTRSNVQRECIDISCMSVAHLNQYLPAGYAQDYTQEIEAWGRHSRFRLNGKPLSVYEMFLPEP